MVKDIIFGGFSAQPDDYLCPDGELSAAANTIPENGALKTILPSKAVMSLPTGCKFLFIHKGIGYEHYIILWEQPSQKAIYWMDSDSDFMTDAYHLIGYFDTLSHVNAVGNTLIIFDDNGMNYFLWQTGNYSALGNQIPFPEISFGLVGGVSSYAISVRSVDDEDHGELDTWTGDDNYMKYGFKLVTNNPTTRAEQNKINDFLAGKITKHQNRIRKEGGFTLPFFVRYALRLYNGDLIMHSAPVLMTPSNFGSLCYVLKGSHVNNNSEQTIERWFDVMTPFGYLAMLVLNSEDYSTNPNNIINILKNRWGDIVKSIDIFVSAPIYPYDINGDFTEITYSDAVKYECIVGGSGDGIEDGQYISYYDGKTVHSTRKFRDDTQIPEISRFWVPELYSNERIKDNIMAASRFYLIKSMPVNSLKDYVDKIQRTVNVGGTLKTYFYLKKLSLEKGCLVNIETQELMSDDSLTHDILMPKLSYTFNNRLNISDISRQLFKGFNPNCLLQYIDVDYGESIDPNLQARLKVEVFVKENNETYKVEADTSYNKMAHFISASDGDCLSRYGFVFYPNPNAIAMRVTELDSYKSITFPLIQHDYLNGACAIFPFWSVRNESAASVPQISQFSDIVKEPYIIRTSEINNPFYFPSVGANTIGTGKVLGMCAAVKALSQGQFGQFPMYAFTTEGVWALSVNSHGGFDAIQPVTRDVCINADSITQLDNAVLFAADRGIMLLSGSQTTCISDNLDATTQFNPIAELPHGGHLAELAGLTEDDLHLLPFKEFIKDCRMIYDYTNQRIVVYNTAKENGEKLCKYAYVYSLKTKSWGMMQTTIVDNVNSYPEALALDETNNVLDLSQPDSLHNANGFIVTRPFKLDYDILKTIRSLIVRGVFARGHVKTALYGSNDLLNWFIVSSSTNHIIRNYSGTPYKYFRLVLLTTMNENESAVGFTVEYIQKQTNQIR